MKSNIKRVPVQRLYLLLLLFLGLLTLLLLLKALLWDKKSAFNATLAADVAAEPSATSADHKIAEPSLPFLWSRTVHAGERITAEMLLPLNNGGDAAEKEQAAALLMSLCGSYVQRNCKAGTQLKENDSAEYSPFRTQTEELAVWLSADSAGGAELLSFDNFQPGDYLGAYQPDRETVAPTLRLIADELAFLQVLAVDRSANTLCLALSPARQLQLAAHLERRDLILLPSAQFGGACAAEAPAATSPFAFQPSLPAQAVTTLTSPLADPGTTTPSESAASTKPTLPPETIPTTGDAGASVPSDASFVSETIESTGAETATADHVTNDETDTG